MIISLAFGKGGVGKSTLSLGFPHLYPLGAGIALVGWLRVGHRNESLGAGFIDKVQLTVQLMLFPVSSARNPKAFHAAIKQELRILCGFI